MRTSASLAFALAACASSPGASSPGAGGGGSVAAAPSPHARANTLTQADIQATQLSNLYDAVRSLRPRWMQTRGTDSFRRPTQIQVYLGGQRLSGGLEALREISSLSVVKVEFVDPAVAAGRWGTGHGEGAIVVTLSAQSP